MTERRPVVSSGAVSGLDAGVLLVELERCEGDLAVAVREAFVARGALRSLRSHRDADLAAGVTSTSWGRVSALIGDPW